MAIKKIYTYSDETGQDTRGDFFLVSTVLTYKKPRNRLREYIEKIEEESKKGKLKWNKTKFERKRHYLKLLGNIPEETKPNIYFSVFKKTKNYAKKNYSCFYNLHIIGKYYL